jgi:cell division protein FtsI (penicillin-binding protein 3)
MFDEPEALEHSFGFATAGWNAAPTTSKIIKRIAPILGVLPQQTNDAKDALLKRMPAATVLAETQGGAYAP